MSSSDADLGSSDYTALNITTPEDLLLTNVDEWDDVVPRPSSTASTRRRSPVFFDSQLEAQRQAMRQAEIKAMRLERARNLARERRETRKRDGVAAAAAAVAAAPKSRVEKANATRQMNRNMESIATAIFKVDARDRAVHQAKARDARKALHTATK